MRHLGIGKVIKVGNISEAVIITRAVREFSKIDRAKVKTVDFFMPEDNEATPGKVSLTILIEGAVE